MAAIASRKTLVTNPCPEDLHLIRAPVGFTMSSVTRLLGAELWSIHKARGECEFGDASSSSRTARQTQTRGAPPRQPETAPQRTLT